MSKKPVLFCIFTTWRFKCHTTFLLHTRKVYGSVKMFISVLTISSVSKASRSINLLLHLLVRSEEGQTIHSSSSQRRYILCEYFPNNWYDDVSSNALV